jgi:hypothetical protein
VKTFKFTYEDIEYEYQSGSWPQSSVIKAKHRFDDDITWVPVLYQFAKFLESTGYAGVVEKVKVEDKYGFHADSGFETYGYKEEENDIKVGLDDAEDDDEDHYKGIN